MMQHPLLVFAVFVLTVCIRTDAQNLTNVENVRAFGEATYSVTVFWKPIQPAKQTGDGFHYKVELKPYNNSTSEKSLKSVQLLNWMQSNYTFTDLDIFQPYLATVSTGNSDGAVSAPSAVFTWSGEGVPEKAPTNLQLKSNSNELTWDPVPEDSVRGLLHGYIVIIVEQKQRQWKPSEANKIVLKVSGTKQSVQLPPQVRADRNYTAKVVAFNTLHLSVPSEVLRIVASKKAITGPVGSLGVHKLSTGKAYLFWSPPDELPNGPVTQYKYGYEELNSPVSHFVQQSTMPPVTGALITDLKPGKAYKFWVQPYSKNNLGGALANVTFTNE